MVKYTPPFPSLYKSAPNFGSLAISAADGRKQLVLYFPLALTFPKQYGKNLVEKVPPL